MEYITLALSAAGVLLSLGALILMVRLTRTVKAGTEGGDRALRLELTDEMRASREETGKSVGALGASLNEGIARTADAQDKRLHELRQTLSDGQSSLQKMVTDSLSGLDFRLQSALTQQEQRLEAMRLTMETRLHTIQQENVQKLDQMRATVDEQLQKTLTERIGQSFQQVSTQLEAVYKGLGEMQSLASDVGGLKKVLSNVKTRGILGELQLGAILEELLSPDQYESDFAPRPGSRDVVEYAVKLPGDGETPVYLPIDAKFPGETYEKLLQANENGNREEIDMAAAELERVIRAMAKDIEKKYVEPPYTTDFGILFLPFEGLYAETVRRRGLVERLQRENRIILAGPTTMAALLNALRMGFKTLAIQKRSGQVWELLGAVKTEFAKFAKGLETTRERLEKAQNELHDLVGTRTRAIERKLRDVETLDEDRARALLEE